MPEAHFKPVGTEATKYWESCGMLQKHLFGKFDWLTCSFLTGDRMVKMTGMDGASLKDSAVTKQEWGRGSPL